MSKIKKERLKGFAKTLGIENIGVCDAEYDDKLFLRLKKRRDDGAECEFVHQDMMLRSSPQLVLNGAKSVIVCLFPYYRKNFEFNNISRYASLYDYHKLINNKLSSLAEFIDKEIEPSENLCFADTGPLNDRYLAYKAGLGFFGKNNCLINNKLGSYFFIGYIITSCKLEFDVPLSQTCMNCGRCQEACPGGAIKDNFGFISQNCVSYITQIKDIDEKQKRILQKQDSVYGCDVCQEVCPHNANIGETCMPEFLKCETDGLCRKELEMLSNRAFRRKYKDFAFSWRSKDIILKNFIGGTYAKQRKDNGQTGGSL